MHWWPRQTPRIGVVAPSAPMSGTDTPASRGVQGPGEMRTCEGESAATSATVTSSQRTTSVARPSRRT